MKLLAAVALSLLVSGCVSSTLNSVGSSDTTANTEAPEAPPSFDPQKREAAVAEMRAKAEDKSGKKTNVFQDPDGPNEPLAVTTAKARIQRLDGEAKVKQEVIPDAELSDKQKAMAELQRKLQRHYDDQLKKIEN